MQSDIRSLEARLSGLPKTQRDILAMERKLGVNEKLAVYLLERKAATIIARASITPEASLIERARYAGKVGPDKRRTILEYTAIGFLIALAIGGGAHGVLRTHRVDLRIARGCGCARHRRHPHLQGHGRRPHRLSGRQPQRCHRVIRALRTNLQYLLAKEGANVILVSSLHPQEGKSFLSANLSSILAKAGKKVALVDFDMHKPRVHHYMGLDNDKGL